MGAGDQVSTAPVLTEWTRTIWASERARHVWAPRVAAITTAWEQIERQAVADGIKPSCLQNVVPDQLPQYVRALPAGLVAVPLTRTGAAAAYASGPQPLVAGGPWAYRVAVTRPDLVGRWLAAWDASDDQAIGELLGYPACCRAFFRRVWVDGRQIDTTWAMGRYHEGCDTDGEPGANILLRWLGVRLVSHLPCSFACSESAELGRRLGSAGRAHGLGQEVGWIEEMLAWPVEWSAVAGIAEIRTPVVRVSTRTDWAAEPLVVRRRGTRYPDEGARGLVFPYRPPTGVKLTETSSYREAFSATAAGPVEDPSAWRDNGFVSRAAMDAAHSVVLRAVAAAAPSRGLLDLGCGGGDLLARARRELRVERLVGVEVDGLRASRGRARNPGVVILEGRIENTDMWRLAPMPDVALLMPGRLLEMADEASRAVRCAISAGCRALVVYAYGDALAQHGSIAALSLAAGLPALERIVYVQAGLAEAGVIRFEE